MLQSVSVITNFVIPKRDKKKQKHNTNKTAARAKFHVYRSKMSPLRGEKSAIYPYIVFKQYRHGCASRRPAGNNMTI